MRYIPVLCFLCLAIGANPAGAGEFEHPSAVVGAGGANCSSAQFRHAGTLGQSTPIGAGAGNGYALHAGFWKKVAVATDVIDRVIPEMFRNALLPNLPNPFNPSTTIRYEVANRSPVEVAIYGIQGRRVRTLVQESLAPGRYEAAWDGRDDHGTTVGSGVYFCALHIGSFGAVQKMILVK